MSNHERAMEASGSLSRGRASEALSRTFTNSPDKFNFPLRTATSLQQVSPTALLSPDMRVFKTPEQHGHIADKEDGYFHVRRPSAHGEEQGFQDHMEQHIRNRLSKEWDDLYLGDSLDDIRSGADVYRALKKDLRSMACALKQSFGFMVDSRQFSSGGAGGHSGVQQLQPCISELKSVAKEMASATRMATDNYNLQVELTLQKHAAQHLLAQLHEAQLARMALEEEMSSLRADRQRLAAVELNMEHQRRLNDALQTEAVAASDNLDAALRRVRELEDRLQGATAQAAELMAKLKEMELANQMLEDLGGASPFSDAASASSECSSLEGGSAGLEAVAATELSGAAGNGGRQSSLRACDVPPEVRQLIGKVLRRRDDEAARLRKENASMVEKLARLRSAAGALASHPRLPTRPSSSGSLGPVGAPAGGAAADSEGEGWLVAAADGTTASTGGLPTAHLQKQLSHPMQHQDQQQSQHAAELASARDTIAKLQIELSEAHERVAAREQQEAETATMVAALRESLAAAEAAQKAAEKAAALSAAQCEALAVELRTAQATSQAETEKAAVSSRLTAAERDQMLADLTAAQQQVAALEGQLAAAASAQSELQSRLEETQRRERTERVAAQGAAREAESVRQRLARLQADMRDVRAEAQVARGEATAASRDVKAANSEKLKAQAEMEEAVERLRVVEAARAALKAQLAEERSARERLEQQLAAAAEAEAEALLQCDRDPAGGEVAVAVAVAELEAALATARRELCSAEERLAEHRRKAAVAQEQLLHDLTAAQSELEAVRQELAAVKVAGVERVSALEAQMTLSVTQATAAAAARAEADADQLRAVVTQLQQNVIAADKRAAELDIQLRGVRAEAQAAEEQTEEVAAELAKATDEAARRVVAQREMEVRYEQEVARLKARLEEAEAAAAAAAAAVSALQGQGVGGGTAGAARSLGTSASSSDAGMNSGSGSPEAERSRGAAEGTAACRTRLERHDGGASDGDGGVVEEEELGVLEGEGAVDVLRARCRALRGELALVRGNLAALVAACEAAAQEQLTAAVAEAQAAVATGKVTSDEEFWNANRNLHSVHALISSLRAISLYSGAGGSTSAVYGDTLADGAGSVAGSSTDKLAARQRRHVLASVRQRCGQVAELLAEAEALVQSPVGPAAVEPPPAAASATCAHANRSGGERRVLRNGSAASAAPVVGSHGTGPAGATGAGGGRVSSQRPKPSFPAGVGAGAPSGRSKGSENVAQDAAAGTGAVRNSMERPPAGGACLGSALESDCMPFARHLGGSHGHAHEYGNGAPISGPSLPPVRTRAVATPLSAVGPTGATPTSSSPRPFSALTSAVAAARGAPTTTTAATDVPRPSSSTLPAPAPVPSFLLGGVSSSFTSDTASSLADEDLAGLSSLYDLPPMASPPKFDLGDLDLASLTSM